MTRVARQVQSLAEQIIAHADRDHKYSKTNSLSIFPAQERLHLPLAALVGSAGYNALLSRALALACPQFPWLCAFHVKTDGFLEGLVLREAEVDPGRILEGRIALLAQLLGLLMALIGEHVTMQLMSEVWPKLPMNDSDLWDEDENARTR